MIFKRREKVPFWSRVRDFFAPKKGWRRGFQYIGKRVQRLPDTPHRIALGFACGALASFSPFFTLHLFVAALYAWIVGGNIIAAAFGTIVGNPISFPLIAAICMQTGNWILSRTGGADYIDKLSFDYATNHPWQFFETIFTPYLIGGLVPGVLCALLCYFLIRPVVARFQKRRRKLLSERAREQIIRPTVQGLQSDAEAASGAGAPKVPPSGLLASDQDWSQRKVG